MIQNRIEDALSDGVLSGKFKAGDTVLIDLIEGNLDFPAKPREAEPEAIARSAGRELTATRSAERPR